MRDLGHRDPVGNLKNPIIQQIQNTMRIRPIINQRKFATMINDHVDKYPYSRNAETGPEICIKTGPFPGECLHSVIPESIIGLL